MYQLPTNFKKLRHVCKGCGRTEEFCSCEPIKHAVFGLDQCDICGNFMASGATCHTCHTENRFHSPSHKPIINPI